MKDYVFYEYCKNAIKVVMTSQELEVGDYMNSTCGFTGDELHYICLGEL